MNFEVIWLPAAEVELAALWLDTWDRKEFTRNTHRIDQALRTTPSTSGEIVFDTVRQLVIPPIGVEYEVIEDDRRVIVLAVWDTDTGRPDPIYN